MVTAVIPACNEAKHIARVIDSVVQTEVERILVVVNGSTDGTLEAVTEHREPRVTVLHFAARLGIDLPRAVGAWFAAREHPGTCLFVDGDMSGVITPGLNSLLSAIQNGADMALTDCYLTPPRIQGLAKDVIRFRERLNSALGLTDQLGLAIPSHGPHAVSARFLARIPLVDIAVPPVSLAGAVREGMEITVSAAIDHRDLGSPLKQYPHSRLIADTIIGDCIEGIRLSCGEPRDRVWEGRTYLGYHPERRFDLLQRLMEKQQDGLLTVIRPVPY